MEDSSDGQVRPGLSLQDFRRINFDLIHALTGPVSIAGAKAGDTLKIEILEYAHKYKNRLKKLVFIGGSYRMPVNQDLIDLAKNGDSDAVKLMMKWGFKDSKKFIGGNPVEKIIQSPRDISEILAIDLVACNNYVNGSNAAKEINCPTMLVFGSDDKMCNLEFGKKFANLINNSITHVIDDCGHMIMIEKAFEMREKVFDFLKK